MKKLTLILLATSPLIMGGCAVTTAAVQGGDRSVTRSMNDISAARAIKARMGRAYEYSLGGVDVEVAEGIAVLSGQAPTENDRIEAEKIAWSAPGIYKVGNEIRIRGKQGLLGNAEDGFLKNAIRTRFVADNTVRSMNYNIEVHDGIVYLLGVAKTPQELERATHIASTTKGTQEVISYVRLAGDPVNTNSYAAQPAPQTYSTPEVYSAPLEAPVTRPLPEILSETPQGTPAPNAPYFRDPNTGEQVILPPGTQTEPYNPNVHGNSGTGGSELPYYVNPENGERIMVVYRPN